MSVLALRYRVLVGTLVVCAYGGTARHAVAQERVHARVTTQHRLEAERFFDRAAAQRLADWRALIEWHALEDAEKLVVVNSYFNRLTQQADEITWGATDYWASPRELLITGAGDCEDFAIAKYVTLVAMGVNPGRLKLALTRAYSPRSRRIERHVALVYQSHANSTRWVLDNLTPAILGAEQRTDLVFTGNVIVPREAISDLRSLTSSQVDVRIEPAAAPAPVSGARQDALRD